MMKPLDEQIKSKLDEHLSAIGNQLNADVIAILSPILPGLDVRLRAAIDAIPNKRSTVALMLDTPGGIVEIVERLVTAIRFIYSEVIAIVPDRSQPASVSRTLPVTSCEARLTAASSTMGQWKSVTTSRPPMKTCRTSAIDAK